MRHVIISYVHENAEEVNKLCKHLVKHDIKVWLDKNDIKPGTFWKTAIRDAISNGSFFVACFSLESNTRSKSYMNEELILAIEELRKRNYNQAWFIPVLLSGEVPSMDIGTGKTLQDLQWVELNGKKNWGKGIKQILNVINPPAIPINYEKIATDLTAIFILEHICKTLAQGKPYLFRAYVMVPSTDNELQVKYVTPGIGPAISDIRFQKWQGIAGIAWGEKKLIIGDILADPKGGASWGLTKEHRNLMKKITTSIAIPVFHPKSTDEILGVLCVDAYKPLGSFFTKPKTMELFMNLAPLLYPFLMEQE